MTRFRFIQFLKGYELMLIAIVRMLQRTSCHWQRGTEPGILRPFSHTAELVKSRQRASMTRPFFSFET